MFGAAMRRRDFIKIVRGSVAAWPLAASAQQVGLRVIGVLRNTSKSDAEFRLAAFRGGLRELGFIESQNIAIEYRYADSKYDRLPAFASELVQRPVEVLFASGNASALAAKRATSTIPVVFAVGNDPVEMGLVNSLSRPNGNVTGISFFTTLVGKRLELMRELTSASATIAYLQDTNNPAAELEANEFQKTAETIGQPIAIIKVKDGDELEAAFAAAKVHAVTGMVVAAGSFEFRWTEKLISLASRHALPTIYAGREIVSAGGLLSYSGSQSEAHRLAGIYCGRILKGDKPADLPVMLPNKLELVVNLKTAKAIGLTIPPAMLARADEVIE
jgi:putative tryptophan/tyrosine transport system substrate-binding protein